MFVFLFAKVTFPAAAIEEELKLGISEAKFEFRRKMPKIYTLEEASKHNTKDDCWVVINGKVYDVTKFLNKHPGGADVFFDVAGKDAKEEFEAAGHGFVPKMMMKFFCIGTVGDPEAEENQAGSGFVPLLYWTVPVAIVGIAVTVGYFYYNKKQ